MSETRPVETAQERGDRLEKRDGEMYIALGIFINAVGLPVLIGTYWALQKNFHAAVVNAVCGIVLLLIGFGSMGYGAMLLARNKRRA